MKIPRDVSGVALSKALSHFGYSVTRQTGSHMRLTTQIMGEHHVSIPAHKPLKVGTLNAILSDVSEHLKISKDEILSII